MSTTTKDDQFLKLQILRDRHTTAVEARNMLRQATRINISERTARRRLKETGLLSRRPATGPLLTEEDRSSRLQFGRQHQHWTMDQ